MKDVDQLIEVRIIGPLEVHRADGSLADPLEWKTAKTRDLFRLLVLERGRLVRTERILDAFWPDVDRAHGTASIRTAASRIRVVTASACVRRKPGGLSVHGVRSDFDALHDLVMEVRRLHAEGDHAGAVRVAGESAGLLEGELHADALDAPSGGDDTWAEEAHEQVARAQREVLTLQGECAIEVGAVQQAVDSACRAIDSDPFWERPYRVLMRALAGMGEPDQALRVYERLRSVLDADLAVQPSARSRRLRDHIQSASTDSMPVDHNAATIPTQRRRADGKHRPEQEDGGLSVVRAAASSERLDPLEAHVLRWLRERARGPRIRIHAAVVDEPCEVFELDLTLGGDGTLQVASSDSPSLRPHQEA
jgi:DNA-binding SARP family transcriptional activator